MKLDRTDLLLLALLQQDGRRTIVELAEDCGLSQTPCARRVRQLEKAGVIQGYAAIIDPSQLDLKVQAYIQVKLERHTDDNVDRFRRALEAIEEIVSCHATTGEHDFMLQVVTQDLEALSTVVLKKLLKIPCVRDVHSSIVLDTVKRSVRVPLPSLRDK
jgi:Lrp/AsnC family transcriptional regulator, leucine-responsive regulatory protein